MDQNMNTEPKLDALTAARMLENIFEESEVEPNTVPAEALAGYEDLTRSRFRPHRIILIGIFVLWLLLPLLFLKPECSITHSSMNEQYMPVYTISVTSALPVEEVTASMEGTALKVLTKDSRTYAVEPEHNGPLEVRVTGANRQTAVQMVTIRKVDETSPVLLSSRMEDDRIYMELSDEGTGVDFENVYALGAESGEIVLPEAADSGAGTVAFSFPEEKMDVFIPDMRGNVLHVSMQER